MLALEGPGVVNVMEGGSGTATAKDGVVGHFLCVVGVAALEEGSLKLLLRLGRLCALHGGNVAEARDVVGLADEGDLVLVLDNAGLFNGGLEGCQVLCGVRVERDVVRDLVGNGIDGRLWAGAAELGEDRRDFGGWFDIVDIVEFEGVVNCGGKAGPDDVLGVDGRDEEGGLVGLDVVDEVAVCEVAASKVVEEATLTIDCQWLLAESGKHSSAGDKTYRKGSGPSLSSTILVWRPSR